MEEPVTRLFIAVVTIVTIVGVDVREPAGAQVAQQPTEGQARLTPPPPPPPPPPAHPSTQSPEHKVTPDQMKKWEKELSNWGRWGKDDERGTLNLITPEKTKAALKLVKEGISVSLHRFPDLTKQVDSWSFGETKHWMSNVDPATNKPRGAVDNVAFGTHDGTSAHMDALCHYAVQSTGPSEPAVVYNGHPQNLDLQGCKADGIDQIGRAHV